MSSGGQCSRCIHLRSHDDVDYCDAFPDGIANEVYLAGPLDPRFGHSKRLKDQDGEVLFEDRDPL